MNVCSLGAGRAGPTPKLRGDLGDEFALVSRAVEFELAGLTLALPPAIVVAPYGAPPTISSSVICPVWL